MEKVLHPLLFTPELARRRSARELWYKEVRFLAGVPRPQEMRPSDNKLTQAAAMAG